MDPLTLQTMEPMGNASVSQDALGNTTIIYEQGLGFALKLPYLTL